MREKRVEEGLAALKRLIERCYAHNGHSTIPVREFLAGLYNDDFAPSMWLLATRVSDADFEDILACMRLIRLTNHEPHMFFSTGDEIWRFLTKGLRRHRKRRTTR